MCSFLDTETYYYNLWPCCSHILAPLTNLIGKGIINWNSLHERAFTAMKALMVEDVILRCPDHYLPFHLWTDASDYQFASIILQQDIPAACHPCKLSQSQQNYTTSEKELLLVVETLWNFRSTLLGADIHVYTYHWNLTCKTLTTPCFLHWHLFIKDFHLTIHYIKGEDNIGANTLSHLPQSSAFFTELCLMQPDADPDYNLKKLYWIR